MIKKIRVEQLKPGIFIHDLNCEWLQHPFLKNRIMIRNEDEIDKIIKNGIREIYIDTEKGIDVADAPAKEDVEQEIQTELDKLSDIKPEVRTRVELKEEIHKASEIIKESKKRLRGLMDDVKIGRQIEFTQVENIVETMMESVFRNKDALISLGRIKQKDEYTYMHSLAVCALLISFGEFLNFDYKTIKDMAVGGLLHDIGKVHLPLELLNKKGVLSEREFETIKKHVRHSCSVLEKISDISENSSYIVSHHHERLNGTGYPDGLTAEEISMFGQIAAIIDVYDALSSERYYRSKMQPSEALRKLFEWGTVYFNRDLVEQFICCIGIYPVGTMVRMESGLLGIVIDHGRKGLLYPVIRAVYDTRKDAFIMPLDIDLSASQGSTDKIVKYESPEKWKINFERYLY